jgi:2-polyprenyl-3-methyl-5-hydroxy-6-metoxy-1,4-benzoquinol methylase
VTRIIEAPLGSRAGFGADATLGACTKRSFGYATSIFALLASRRRPAVQAGAVAGGLNRLNSLVACPLCGSASRRSVLVCRDHLVTAERFDVAECDGCGLRMTEPQPSPEAIGRYYESEQYLPMSNARRDAIARVYRAVRRLTVRLRLRLVARHAPRIGRLLDVGCGTGEFLAHARGAGWDVVGVEPAAGAAGHAAAIGLTIHRTADLDGIDEHPFDAVTMWHALEHMHEPGVQLTRAHRLLAPDGCLVVAVPNHDCVDAGAYAADWYAWDVPRHLWHFTATTLGRLVGRHGFEVTGVHALPFDPFYIALMSERRGRPNLVRVASIAMRSMLAAWRDPARGSTVVVVARPARAAGAS